MNGDKDITKTQRENKDVREIDSLFYNACTRKVGLVDSREIMRNEEPGWKKTLYRENQAETFDGTWHEVHENEPEALTAPGAKFPRMKEKKKIQYLLIQTRPIPIPLRPCRILSETFPRRLQEYATRKSGNRHFMCSS